jgi:hypothetical protein
MEKLCLASDLSIMNTVSEEHGCERSMARVFLQDLV